MWVYQKASAGQLELLWNRNIARHNQSDQWRAWKEEYLFYNRTGMAITFAAVQDGDPVGEGTLLLSPDCAAIRGREALCDGLTTPNVNALCIQEKWEGQGHISALMRVLEQTAAEMGIRHLTIGVEAKETRNLAIYLHWGYNRFVHTENEDGTLVLYYAKDLSGA